MHTPTHLGQRTDWEVVRYARQYIAEHPGASITAATQHARRALGRTHFVARHHYRS